MFSRFFAWLFGPSTPALPSISKRMTIDGVELENLLVFAKGREATANELMTVFAGGPFKIEGGEGSRLPCSTEQWNSLPGESEGDAIRRIARETSEKFSGMFVVALAWPDSYPTIIVAIVTVTHYPSPFPALPHTLVTGIKSAENRK